MKLRNSANLLFCVFACLAAFGFGGLFIPGEWYESLNRAPWNPPNIVFPIVWPLLYIMIAIAGWRIFSLPKADNSDLRVLWIIQLIANALWSWVFFGQHWVAVALINILLIDLLVAAIIVMAWQRNLKIISGLMMPYIAWLSLATSLNIYILIMN